jgi:hypothetical protein
VRRELGLALSVVAQHLGARERHLCQLRRILQAREELYLERLFVIWVDRARAQIAGRVAQGAFGAAQRLGHAQLDPLGRALAQALGEDQNAPARAAQEKPK